MVSARDLSACEGRVARSRVRGEHARIGDITDQDLNLDLHLQQLLGASG